MAYALLTQSIGAGFANQQVQLTDSVTGRQAIVLATLTGGVITRQGFSTLDGSGNLSCYVDTSYTWIVTPTKAVTHPGQY